MADKVSRHITVCSWSSKGLSSNISLKQRNHLKRKQRAIIKTVDQNVEYSCSSETFIINKKCRKWTKLFWNVLNKRITQTNYLMESLLKGFIISCIIFVPNYCHVHDVVWFLIGKAAREINCMSQSIRALFSGLYQERRILRFEPYLRPWVVRI